jgi:hypothetical protein
LCVITQPTRKTILIYTNVQLTEKKNSQNLKKKIRPDWKIIIAESIGIIFLIHGVSRLHKSYNSDIWKAFLESDSENLKNQIGISLGDFLLNSIMFGFYILIVSVMILLLIKWKMKLPLIDTFLSLILVFLLFPIGFFEIDFITALFNSIGAIFSNDIGYSFLISGLILTLIGLIILWKGIKINKNYTQHRV